LTELLTVVSVIAILTSMMSPVVLKVRQEAGRIKCTENLAQINTALSLVANQQNGKLPRCFDNNPGLSTVNEHSWWYRKVAQVAYPTETVAGVFYDHLTVPLDNNAFWNSYGGKSLFKFNPDNTILRCPASRDHYWQFYAPGGFSLVSGSSNPDVLGKDRVFDDSYGFNNHGGSETIGGQTKKYGFQYTAAYGGELNNIYHKALSPLYFGTGTIYHNDGPRPNRGVQGSYFNDHPRYTYVGGLADIAEPGITLVIVDYIKADVAPTWDYNSTYAKDGYVFRHGGKLNALFADGHVEGYREHLFRQALDPLKGSIRWAAKRP
jgi:prepilin-type processing-associated H-X9-DG protein